ncbi:MAG: hypothetical protein K6E85_02520 [Lachnospiraceae bacterium]|nr:hypothetical protein [Lachnospiraceae bacterium]
MRIKMKRFLGILLSIVLALGLMPGMSLTAYAATYSNGASVSVQNLHANDVLESGVAITISGGACFRHIDGEHVGNIFNNSSWTTDKKYKVESCTNDGGSIWTLKLFGYHDVTITGGANATTSGGNTTQTGVAGAMTTVTYTANSGYHFTEFANITNNGITAMRTSDMVVTVSGTARADASITIPDAVHAHSFTSYSASDATITATCTATGCTLPESSAGAGNHVATLTIAANGGTYDGSTAYGATITDANSIQGDAKVQYQKKSGESYGTATETAPTDAGDYKASITVGGVTASVEYTIAQADPTVTAPTAKTLTYTGQAQELVIAGSTEDGTLYYAVTTENVAPTDESLYTTSIPAKTDAGTYYVWYKVAGDSDHNDTAASCVIVTIKALTASVNVVDIANGETLSGATLVILDENKETIEEWISTDEEHTSTALIAGKEYTLRETVAPNGYMHAGDAKFVIDETGKVTSTGLVGLDGTMIIENIKVTAPVAKTLTYTGSALELVTPGSVTGDKMYYALGTNAQNAPSAGWNEAVPTAVNAGTYYVWYRVDGYTEAVITVKIAKAAAPVLSADQKPAARTGLSDTDGTQALVSAPKAALPDGYTMVYARGVNAINAPEEGYGSEIPSGSSAGTYYVWYKVVGDENHNDTEAAVITVTISEEPQSEPKPEPQPEPTPQPTDDPVQVPVDIDEANDWNLFEDASVHNFVIKSVSINAVVENSNEKSQKYYDAKLIGSVISVAVTGDRKDAVKKANTVLEFKLADGSVVEYTLPVSYVKPNLSLGSSSGTIKKGTESVLKTTVMVVADGGQKASYNMKDAKVTAENLGTVSVGEDGRLNIKTSAAGKGSISISKEGWDGNVSLKYTVKAVDKDVLTIDPELKSVTLNSNAKGQVFTYEISLNGSAPAAGAVELVDKKNSGLATVSGNKLIIAYKDGVKAGSYSIRLKAGDAKAETFKIKLSEKALDKAISLKMIRKYNVVTKQSMMVGVKLKNVGGSIERVSVSENGFSASMNAAGNIFVNYSGTEYNAKKLKIGKLTFGFKISGIDTPVTVTLNNVKACKSAPKVKAATVVIPKDKEFKEGDTIGTANIVSYHKFSYGRYLILEPKKAEIVGKKNVTAIVNEKDPKEINIKSITGKSGWVKVKLTYDGEYTKTIKIRVKKK